MLFSAPSGLAQLVLNSPGLLARQVVIGPTVSVAAPTQSGTIHLEPSAPTPYYLSGGLVVPGNGPSTSVPTQAPLSIEYLGSQTLSIQQTSPAAQRLTRFDASSAQNPSPLVTTPTTFHALGLRWIKRPQPVSSGPGPTSPVATAAASKNDIHADAIPGSLGNFKVKDDYDGDGKTDIAYFNPANGTWTVSPSSNPAGWYAISGFASNIIPVPGDYDGDGKTDIAYFNPAAGFWVVSPSSNPAGWYVISGFASDIIPVPGDYDGDGKTDIAYFDPAAGLWVVSPSSNPAGWYAMSGFASDIIPISGDFDGDGETDISYFNPANGTWTVSPSSNAAGWYAIQGFPSNITPTPGDYDGDGKTDISYFNPANGTWTVSPSSDPAGWYAISGFSSGTVPISAGDFDGDGKAHIAYFIPANGSWTVSPSSNPADWYQISGFANALLFPGFLADTISGQVLGGGTGLPGVTITLSGASSLTTTTDANGNYWLTVPDGGTYTVTPSDSSGDTFSPASQTFSNVSANQSASFGGSANTISGQILAGGSPLSGATVSLSGTTSAGTPISLTTTTDANGTYSFTVPAGGTYTVAASAMGYTISPSSFIFNGVTGNETANASASIQTTSLSQDCTDISGTCTDGLYTYTVAETLGDVTGSDTLLLLPYGSVTWTVSGQTTDGATFTMRLYDPNPTQTDLGGIPDQEDDFTLTSLTCSTVKATLTSQIQGGGGSAFLSAGNATFAGQSTTWTRTSSPPAATTTPDITVIGWIDASQIALPTPETPELAAALNGGTLSCSTLIGEWALLQGQYLNGPPDVAYANAWLISHSANNPPPNLINKASVLSAADFRLFSDFQVTFNSGGPGLKIVSKPPVIGATPDPCGSPLRFSAQEHPSNGYTGIDSLNRVFQLAEGRVGATGQSVNATINGDGSPAWTTPWIWGVIEFNASGNFVIPFDHATFPTYSIYWNGALVKTCHQSSVSSFASQNGSSQRLPNQVPVGSGIASCQ